MVWLTDMIWCTQHSLIVNEILHIDGQNLLAVLVYPPADKNLSEGGQGGDHEIGKDVAAQYIKVWDCMAAIRERNAGIWEEVSISVTRPVKILDPNLVSSFFDNNQRVYLPATTELKNRSLWVAECSLNIQVTIELHGSIYLVKHSQTRHVSIPPGVRLQYTFHKLFFYKPNWWWPNDMENQSLYNLGVTIDMKDPSQYLEVFFITTIRATMPPEGWQIPLFEKLADDYIEEVLNPIWEYHQYMSYSKPSLVHDQIKQYGTSKHLDDFFSEGSTYYLHPV